MAAAGGGGGGVRRRTRAVTGASTGDGDGAGASTAGANASTAATAFIPSSSASPSWAPSSLSLFPCVGHISRVILQDFMCHAHLACSLDASTSNVITGVNGSGKSAIIAGIVAALAVSGAGSGAAGRAGKAHKKRNLIRDVGASGSASASATVWIHNAPEQDAYMHETYGPFIGVCRTLGHGAGVKLLAHDGKVVSTRVADLREVLDFLNVDVANPSVALTQDGSRAFLTTSTPAQKFDFFLRATLLDKVIDALKLIEVHGEAIEECLATRHADMLKLESERQEAITALSNLDMVTDLYEQERDIERLLVWANVYASEDAHAASSSTAETARKKIAALKSTRSAVEQSVDLARSEAEDTFQDAAKAREVEMSANEARRHAAAKEARARAAADVAREALQEGARRRAAAHASATAAAAAAVTASASATAASRSIDEKVQVKRNDLEQATAILRDAIAAKQKNEACVLRDIASVPAAASAAAAAGQRLAQFRARLSSKPPMRGFHRTPVGPIGAYITVTDPVWAAASMACIGRGFLSSYVVHDNHDRARLLAHLAGTSSSAMPPTILVARFDHVKPHAITKPWKGTITVNSVVEIAGEHSTLLRNLLIDHCRIERIALFRTFDEGKAVVFRRSKSAAAGPDEAYLADGTRLLLRGKTETVIMSGRTGGVPTAQSRKMSPAGSAAKTPNAALKQLEEEHELALADAAAAEVSLKQSTQALEREKKRVAAALENRTRVRRQLDVLEVERNERDRVLALDEALRREQEHAPSDEEEGLCVSDATRRRHQLCDDRDRELQAAQKSLQDADEAVVNAQRHLKDAKRRAEECEQEIEESMSELAAADAELANTEAVYAAASSVLSDLAKAKEKALRQAKSLAGTSKTATRAELHIGTNASAETRAVELSRQLRIVRSRLSALSDEAGAGAVLSLDASGREAVRRRLAKKAKKSSERFEEARSTLDGALNVGHRLKQMLSGRRQALEKSMHMLKQEVAYAFNAILYNRGHTGSLDVNFETGELDVVVKMKGNENAGAQGYCAQGIASTKSGQPAGAKSKKRGKEASSGEDLRGLSGGERSYATLAFVMALARVSESPLQILDEPDVFMDPVTRQAALDLMLAEQRRSRTQLIYATPHDVNRMLESSRKRSASDAAWQCKVHVLAKRAKQT